MEECKERREEGSQKGAKQGNRRLTRPEKAEKRQVKKIYLVAPIHIVINQSPDNVREFPSRHQAPNPGHTLHRCREGLG